MRISVEIDSNNIVTGYGICLSDEHVPLENGTLVETEIDVDTIIGNYKLVDGVLIEMTEDEKQVETTIIQNAVKITELKQLLLDTDYVVIKIAEGVATMEEYADTIAQRQAWREEINQLEISVD